MRNLLLSVLLFFLSASAYSQNKAIDSLQAILSIQKTDTNKVNSVNLLAKMFRAQGNTTSTIKWAKEGLALARKIGFKRGEGTANMELGFAYTMDQKHEDALLEYRLAIKSFREGGNKTNVAKAILFVGNAYAAQRNYAEALNNYLDALKQYELLKDNPGLANCHSSIGQLYASQENRVEAIKHFFKAFGIYEALKDKLSMAITLNSIGVAHQMQAHFEGAINYYRRSLSISEELGNKIQIISAANNMGNALLMQKRNKEALEIHLYALKLVNELNNPSALVARTKGGIGEAFENMGASAAALGDEGAAVKHYSEALKYFLETLQAAEQSGSKTRIANANWHLGTLYTKMRKYDLARSYLQKSLSVSQSINYKMTTALSYESLAALDSLQGNYKEAYGHYRAYMEQRDSSFINDVTMRKLSEAKGRFEFIQKEDSLKMEQKLTAERLKQQQLLGIQQQQQLKLQEASLLLSNQHKELNRLAFLRAQSQLQVEQVQRQEREKQLQIAEKERALQQANLKLKSNELDLKEREIRAKNIQRNTVVAGSVVILALGLMLWQNNRNKQIAYNLLEKQRMRTQIASDLHDDIGSTLTSISYYSELAKMQLPGENLATKNFLDKIGNSARTIVNTMSDIVWVINPDNDVNGNLVRRIRTQASDLCSDRNIEYCVEADDEAKGVKLNMQQRKNLYFIFKEGLHNAVKYSDCSKIDIRFLQIDDEVQLVVKDNGRGFDINNAREGNGLINMKRRAEEIDAMLNIDASFNKGTCVSLKLKIT